VQATILMIGTSSWFHENPVTLTTLKGHGYSNRFLFYTRQDVFLLLVIWC